MANSERQRTLRPNWSAERAGSGTAEAIGPPGKMPEQGLPVPFRVEGTRGEESGRPGKQNPAAGAWQVSQARQARGAVQAAFREVNHAPARWHCARGAKPIAARHFKQASWKRRLLLDGRGDVDEQGEDHQAENHANDDEDLVDPVVLLREARALGVEPAGARGMARIRSGSRRPI